MNKKRDFSRRDIITVYQFMSMCGLECGKNRSIPISHEAMIRKLRCRNEKFPDKVCLPVRLPFKSISYEQVKCGAILLVEDDFRNLIPYKKPQLLVERVLNYTEEERQKIREKLIAEEMEKHKEEISEGYLRYLLKKDQRELEMEHQRIQEELTKDREDAMNGYTEEFVKVRKLGKRVY